MKQKTMYHNDVNTLDEAVNNFEANHKVKATQSYYANGNHYRVLFFE
jgi:hypothetical protein